MKLKILSVTGSEIGQKDLPEQFNEPVRTDLIQRAVLAIHSHQRHPYGAFPLAGKQASVRISKRRREFRGTYGIGQSRIPRKSLSRNGTRFNWVGAYIPGTVKGRQAHPPKAGKNWAHKINRQERHKAIRSALSATVIRELVEQRGHHAPKEYPFLVENKLETLKNTHEALEALRKLGFQNELERCLVKKIRSGKGKLRGRRYKIKKGPLLVVQPQSSLLKAARNLPGVDVVEVPYLNAHVLAPGAHPGRLTLFTEGALEILAQRKLFTRHAAKSPPIEKEEKKTKQSAAPVALKTKKEKPAKKAGEKGKK